MFCQLQQFELISTRIQQIKKINRVQINSKTQQNSNAMINSGQFQESMLKRIKDKTNQFLQLNPISQFTVKRLLEQIVASQQFQQWIVLKALIQCEAIKARREMYNYITKSLQELLSIDQTIVMKIFLHGWMKQNNIRVYRFNWPRQIKDMIQNGKLMMFNSWIGSQNVKNQSIVATVQMLTKYFPVLAKEESISIQLREFQFILHIVCYVDLTQPQDFQFFDNLLSLIKRFKTSQYKKQQETPLILISTVLDVLSNAKHSTGNVGWLFLKDYISQHSIINFFYYYTQHLLSMTQTQLVTFFSNIFQNSLQQNALLFYSQTSNLFKQTEQYYELKMLYQKVTLPIIIRRGKARKDFSQLVYDIGLFYVIGFYHRCEIGKNGLICILSNIDRIQLKFDSLKQKWINLALFVAEKNQKQYIPIVYQQLEKQGFKKSQIHKFIQQKQFQFEDKTIWQINTRNSRKKKIYPRNRSQQYKGIYNQSVQCYIISVLQALYTTNQLPIILNSYQTYKRNEFCYHLKQLFGDLRSRHNSEVNVNNVKKYGPNDFTQSPRQEDAQQYLVKLLEKVEDQLKNAKQNILLDEFYKTFNSTIHRTLKCKDCGHAINREEKQFLHTIPNRSSIRQQQIQNLTDYKCEKCSNTNVLNIIKLHPTSRIFIVHINRFSFRYQKSQKELATQNIKREVMGYRLRGIVFHIGKNVESGHYVYYYNVLGKKWAEMNDQNVLEFNLEDENEEFQSQMKAQMTPYLLFYTKIE